MDVKKLVYKIIADKLEIEESTITDSKTFPDLGADSLDTVEFIMALESEFDISIPDEQAGKLETVGDVIKYIEANVKSAKVVHMEADAKPAKAAA
jgi:acyl carrier protein